MNCIFCRVVSGEIPSRKVYEDDEVYAFHDINPQAPTHVLVIPRRHIEKLSDISEKDLPLMGKLLHTAKTVAESLDLHNDGFRLVINNGANAHQTVFHLHVHVLGGRRFTWPPG